MQSSHVELYSEMLDAAKNSYDIVVCGGIAKFYLNDGRVAILYELKIDYCTNLDDNFLPKRRILQVKSDTKQ